MVSDASVYFTDGFVFSKEFVVISSRLNALDDYEHSRILIYKGKNWGHFDVDLTVRSVCGVNQPIRTLYSLGREGVIDISSGGRGSQESINDAGVGPGKLGYLNVMRQIAGRLYVCGVSGQLYRRDPGGWAHFDQGVLDPKGGMEAQDIYCIDGTSSNDIYAVGQRGLLVHFDGAKWMRLPPPTGSHLNWIRCVSPTEVYICANGGGFFKGYADHWENYSLAGSRESFWCVEVFKGIPFLASSSGLYNFDGKSLQKVRTDINPTPDGHRLHSNDEVLWSFGTERLCFFDGKKWTYVKHPDNPE
jgi:hypothetical protein